MSKKQYIRSNNNSKTVLLNQAKNMQRLKTIESRIFDSLEEQPIDIDCKDVSKNAKATVFCSLCDGRKRARVIHYSAATFMEAWEQLKTELSGIIQREGGLPRWVKLDLVDHVERREYASMKQEFLKLKYPNFFRMGFSLDYKMKVALTEAEANSYKIYDYSVIPLKASLPGHENTPCIRLEQLNKYLKLNNMEEVSFILPYVYFFTCRSLLFDASEGTFELYRDGTECGRRRMEELTSEFVKQIVDDASCYLSNQLCEDHTYIYGYFPPFDSTLTSYNILRHAGTTWSLMIAYELTRNEVLLLVINETVLYLLSEIVLMDDDTAFLLERKSLELKLGGSGIAIITLAKHMELIGEHDFTEIIRKLANGIIYLQNQQTGQLTHVLNSEDYSVKEEFRTVYYDGESAYALVKAYEISKEERFLQAAQLSIDYFISKNYIIYRDHWLSYAMNAFTKHVSADQYIDFALRNAWENRQVIRNQETTYHTYLELLLETYDLFRRARKDGIHTPYMDEIDEDELREIIKYRAWHMLDGFFFPEYAMYMSKPGKVLGSFFVRHDQFRDRIDDNQHNLDAYVKYYQLMFE